ncbi:hypothetical protein CQW23_32356 [Capsicum baccatum]|uniref:Phospholipase D C-terminal domain-containing protein n=1 Tax=Capsicum baccatum TaxID=33114 RepID=A0A2G2V4Y1_CAPBA|nr:hypothetical protein CQW23_32356 [Capsicum baccatum]
MIVFGEHNWLQYAADEVTEMRGHLLKYPVEVDRTGKGKSLHGAGELFGWTDRFPAKKLVDDSKIVKLL